MGATIAMMDDRKKEDYPISMPPLNGRVPPRFDKQTANGTSAITNNPTISILAYCTASISMTVINKFCVSGKDWNLTFFFLAVQSLVCVVAIMACKSTGLIKNLTKFDSEKAKIWFPISVLLVGTIYTSTKALQFLSVPVYTIFKNLAIIAIAYGEVIWFGGSVTPTALLSFGLMVLSSVVAAWADIQHALDSHANDPSAAVTLTTLNAGYTWVGLNVFCNAAFVLRMRKVIKKMNFNDWDTMFYNNLLTIPVLIVCTFVFEDWSSDNVAKNFPVESRNSLMLAMAYSGIGAVFISYCTAWCIRVTSSTTYSMVGALNKLPIALSGLVFFDAPVTLGSVSAIFLGFISGIVYAWAKIRQSASSKLSLPISHRDAKS